MSCTGHAAGLRAILLFVIAAAACDSSQAHDSSPPAAGAGGVSGIAAAGAGGVTAAFPTRADCEQDGAASAWIPLVPSAPDGLTGNMVIAGDAPGTLLSERFDGTHAYFAFSFDGGASWCQRRSTLDYKTPYGFVSSLADSRTLYGYFVSALHRSVDGGRTWEPRGKTATFPQLATSSVSRDVVFACAPAPLRQMKVGCGVSTDGGATFLPFEAPDEVKNARVVAMAMDGTDQDRAYLVATDDPGSGPAVSLPEHAWLVSGTPGAVVATPLSPRVGGYVQLHAFGHGELVLMHLGGTSRSRDSGATWDTDPAEHWVASAREPSSAAIVAVAVEGTFRSEDHGRTWTRIGAQPPSANQQTYAVAPRVLLRGGAQREAYFRTGERLYRFDERVSDWTETYTRPTTSALRVTGRQSPVLWNRFAAPAPAFYRSSDGGKIWSETPRNFEDVRAHRSDGNVVIGASTLEQVQFSSDGGLTFHEQACKITRDTSLPPPSDASFTRPQVVSGRVTALQPVGPTSQSAFYAVQGGTLVRSNAAGDECTPLIRSVGNPTDPFSYGFQMVEADPDRGYAFAASGDALRLAATRDGWRSWTVVDPGLVEWFEFTVDPSSGDNVYACGIQVCRRSTDGGATWRTIYDAGADIRKSRFRPLALAPDWTRPGVLYIGALQVSRSDDDGATWHDVVGDPQPVVPDQLLVDSVADGFVWTTGPFGALKHRKDR